jgi:four helix bundle protein
MTPTKEPPMTFDALEIALQLIGTLKPLVAAVGKHDKDLADQLRRAATSVALNLSEGRERAGRDQQHFWRIAAGSVQESRTCLRVALQWGHLDGADLSEALALLDRLGAITWRLRH